MREPPGDTRIDQILDRLEKLREKLDAWLAAHPDEPTPVWAAWNPLIDDPATIHDDGRPHPDEAAISNRLASVEAKAEAWSARADRLYSEGKVLAADRAYDHAEYFLPGGAGNPHN
jgi:hypothetical protein